MQSVCTAPFQKANTTSVNTHRLGLKRCRGNVMNKTVLETYVPLIWNINKNQYIAYCMLLSISSLLHFKNWKSL